jgi:hypothetical protein
MNDFSYAADANIKRFRNLLETAVDETARRTIQRLLTEEVAKAFPNETLPDNSASVGASSRRVLVDQI